MLPRQPVHTYSIVAHDPATGDLGVAVQSHWFCVGCAVVWAEPGAGVAVVQADAEPWYGQTTLDRLRTGERAQETLAFLLQTGPRPGSHQIALLDRGGEVAAHTGPHCIPESGHVIAPGISAQANMMLTAQVWPAMRQAFEGASGTLADRMLAALDAAEGCGGDIRGKQSAAMTIIRPRVTGDRRQDRPVDLRVDDHPSPLAELRRLLALRRAVDHADRGFELLWHTDPLAAAAAFTAADRCAPEQLEFRFWLAWSLLKADRWSEAVECLGTLFEAEPRWAIVLERVALSDNGFQLHDGVMRAVERAKSRSGNIGTQGL